ncbi:MAG: dephospho-CoA kinase [Chloroflexi bacterium]|nr:MAG: dephospho-CoA kinase [Chloroflexota bacterium]
MKTIGIAGAIGAGKSSVARALVADAALARDVGGALHYFNADEALREARNQAGPLRDSIAKLIPAAQSPDGSLDQAALASAAFNDPALLKQLELLQWPVARAAMHVAREEAVASGASLLLVEAIALLSSGLTEELDGYLVLSLPTAERRERAIGRGMSGAAFEERDAAQHGLTEALLAAGGVEVSARGSVQEVAAAAGRALRLLCSTDEPHPDPAT